LIRFGKSHMFNNFFFNYRRQVVSVRVGARLKMDNNMFLVNAASAALRDDDLLYYVEELLTGFEEDGGGLQVEDSFVWLSDAACQLDPSASGDLSASYGTTPDMLADYSATSRATIEANRLEPGAELADYVFATAGHGKLAPFNSALSPGREAILASAPASCQE
jgi:pectate lyase